MSIIAAAGLFGCLCCVTGAEWLCPNGFCCANSAACACMDVHFVMLLWFKWHWQVKVTVIDAD
jgi:hypothetical protein